MKKSLFVWAAVAALLSGCHPSAAPLSDTSRAAPQANDVQIVAVSYGPVEAKLTLAGQVNPTEHGRADVTTPLQGIVINPLVKVGDRVRAGDSLAEINSVYGQTPMQLQQKLEADQANVLASQTALEQAVSTLGQARSTLAAAETTASQAVDNLAQARSEEVNAKHDLRRKCEGFKVGVSAQSDVDDAVERMEKAVAVIVDSVHQERIARRAVDLAHKNIAPAEETVRLARRNIEIAQKQVEHDQVIAEGALHPTGRKETQFYIRSPIDGIVYAVNMSAGLAVSPGTILASVVDTHQVYVDANAYESDLRGVRAGDPMAVHADGFPNETFHGHVSYIGKQVDPNLRTVAVRSVIENHHDDLRPGLFVTAELTSPHTRQALLVPNEAVLIDGTEHYVLVMTSPGHYQKRRIEEGVRTETTTEAVSGLKAGEQVVTHGNLLVVPE